MSEYLVSIMMPAYNAAPYIAQAVESALAQTYPDWELIVIDDGSTDQTALILSRYTDRRIKVFHQANGGEAAARNTALDHASGKYLAFLDADDVFLPDHLETAVNYFRANPDRDGLYTDGYYINQGGQRLKPLSARRRGPYEGDIFEPVTRSSDVFGAPVCVILSRQAIIERQIRFDPEIVIGPDWDFLTRYAEWARFGYLPKTTCLYRVHDTNISLRTKLEKRNRSLARCREKAVGLARFRECSEESRTFVFYDLLINLLPEKPEHQAEILQWPEFRSLPEAQQARLIRLMANNLLLSGKNTSLAGEWLRLARQLYPVDKKTLFIDRVYRLSPELCRFLLRVKLARQPEPLQPSPFADLLRP